jgi:hypothetical protein
MVQIQTMKKGREEKIDENVYSDMKIESVSIGRLALMYFSQNVILNV